MIIQNPILTGSVALNGLNLTATNLATTSSNSFTSDQSITGSLGISVNTTIAGTLTVTGSIVGLATSASYVLNAVSSSKAASASYSDTASFANSFNVAGNLTASNAVLSGTLTAQTLVVQTITSSIDFVTGSTRFGSLLTNTHTFTGSIYQTGSIAAFAGSVGIGTTNPNSSLHIYNPSTFAALRLQNVSATSSSIYVVQTDSTGLGNNGFGIYDVVNSSYRFIINNSGSIGIGTTSPSLYGSPRKLHVHSTDDTRGILIQNTVTSSFAELHLSASREYRIGVGGSSTTAGGTANNFYVYDGTVGAFRLMISSSGNIGMGTTNPIASLHIYSANQNEASSLSTSYSNAKFRLEPFNTSGVGISMGLISPNVNYLQSSYSDGVTTAPFVMQPYGGNVGISTTSPTAKLHTYSTSSGLLSLYESTTNDTQIRFINSSTGGRTYSMGSGGSSSAGGNGFYLYDETAYLPRIYLNSFGSVGIGVTSINWNYSGIQALQIKNGFLYGYSNYEVGIGANAYYASAWKFIEAATATMYFCANRSHEFRNSTTTGTANATITWTTPLRIDSSGYVYKESQPIISGQVGTTQSAGLTVGTLIPFDDFWVSRGITYNSSTRRFTVPVAGVYRITLNPFFISGVASGRVLIGINTDTPTPANHKGNTYREAALYDTGCLNSVVTLAASDYIVFLIYQGQLYNGGLTDAFNQFTIELIG